jgi:hypothetical protein
MVLETLQNENSPSIYVPASEVAQAWRSCTLPSLTVLVEGNCLEVLSANSDWLIAECELIFCRSAPVLRCDPLRAGTLV